MAIVLHEIPPVLRNVLQRDPDRMEASPMFTAALAHARAGVPVLPTKENDKDPHTVGTFRRGGKSATTDVERVREHWFHHPYDNVGWGSDGKIVLADIDPRNGGSLEAMERLGLPTDAYREKTPRGGWHIPLTMPAGAIARRSCTLAPGVELKAAGSYVVTAHSQIGGAWYRPEPGRDIWRFGAIPERWEHLASLTGSTSGASKLVILPEDDAEARKIADRMRLSTHYGDGITALLDGDPEWARYFPSADDTTDSGRDFQLVLAGSHFLRNHPRRTEILYAMLLQTGWPHDPRRAHPKRDPEGYAQRTVAKAIAIRDARNRDQHDAFIDRFVLPVFDGPTGQTPQSVFDASLLPVRERSGVMEAVVLGFAASDEVDEYTRDDRWRRLPVQVVADVFGVRREAVRRRLVALEARGMIERQAPPYRHDGTMRRDSLIRVALP